MCVCVCDLITVTSDVIALKLYRAILYNSGFNIKM